MHGIAWYLSTLAPALKLHKNDFLACDRDYMLSEVNSLEEFQEYLQSKTEVNIDWIDDVDFSPRPIFKGNKYSQKIVAWMMLTDALRGGVSRSAVSKAMRNLDSDKDIEEVPETRAHRRLRAGRKHGVEFGILEHRYPMNVMVDYLADKVFDVRHMARAMKKYNQHWWVTHRQDAILNAKGLQKTLPLCGTDRYEYCGFAL